MIVDNDLHMSSASFLNPVHHPARLKSFPTVYNMPILQVHHGHSQGEADKISHCSLA